MKPFLRRVADDFAPQTVEQFVDFSQKAASQSRTWGIYRDGELGGVICLDMVNPVTGLGHITCKKEFWGRKTTDPACQLALEAIFNEAGLLKISAMVFADNQAARSLYKRFGGKEEGVLRSQTMRGGEPVDMILVGLTAEDFKNGTDHRTGRVARSKEQLAKQSDIDVNNGEQLQPSGDGAAGPDIQDAGKRPVKSKRRSRPARS